MPNDKYKVLMAFKDGDDKNARDRANWYNTGDDYPRDGYTPSKSRLDYLLSAQCMNGKGPVIKSIVQPQRVQQVQPKVELPVQQAQDDYFASPVMPKKTDIEVDD